MLGKLFLFMQIEIGVITLRFISSEFGCLIKIPPFIIFHIFSAPWVLIISGAFWEFAICTRWIYNSTRWMHIRILILFWTFSVFNTFFTTHWTLSIANHTGNWHFILWDPVFTCLKLCQTSITGDQIFHAEHVCNHNVNRRINPVLSSEYQTKHYDFMSTPYYFTFFL